MVAAGGEAGNVSTGDASASASTPASASSDASALAAAAEPTPNLDLLLEAAQGTLSPEQMDAYDTFEAAIDEDTATRFLSRLEKLTAPSTDANVGSAAGQVYHPEQIRALQHGLINAIEQEVRLLGELPLNLGERFVHIFARHRNAV